MSNRDLLLHKHNHDIAISRYDLNIVDGDDAIAQRLKIRLKLYLNSWFLDRSAGLPYYEAVLHKRPDRRYLENLFKVAIKTTPGVLEILDFTLDFEASARVLIVRFTVSTAEGEVSMSEVIA